MIPTFTDDSHPFIQEPWILRDDKSNLVIYKLSTSELKYFILSPPQAIILPFFNGKLNFKKIKEIWFYINGKRTSKMTSLFNDIVENLTHKDKVLSISGIPSESISNGNIIKPNLKKYEWPKERTQYPISVMVTFTNRCSTDCLYCYAERNETSELSFLEWTLFFDELDKYGIRIVDIGGGDPFMRRDILELLTEMCRRQYVFFISTKSFISKYMAESLSRIGIGIETSENLNREIQISIDSIDNQIANFLTRTRNYFTRANKSIKNLLNAGIKPRIKTVLTPYNFQCVESLIKYFANIGIIKFQFVQYGRSYYHHDDSLFLTKEQKMTLHNLFPRIKDNYPELDIVFQDDLSAGEIVESLSMEQWHNRAMCTGGRTSLIVLSNGDCVTCEQLPHTNEYVVGNITKNSLDEIWNGSIISDLLHPPKERYTGTPCFNCDYYDDCHTGKGHCYRDALFAYNNFYQAPPNCPFQTERPKRLI